MVATARRRLGAGIATLVLAMAAAGCSSSSKAGTPTTAPAPRRNASGPNAPTSVSVRGYAVGSRTLTWVDPSRPTKGDANRGIPHSTSRTLKVLLLYPAQGKPDAQHTITAGAPPAAGRFPMVVFSHGVTANGPIYRAFVAPWTARGYVVALPTYPMTSGNGAWADLTDYQNQPADVSFMIGKLAALNTTAGDPLAGHLATSEVAAAGHSLGAITSLGLLNSCCRDKRVKAIVAISGALLPFPPNGSFDGAPAVPLLLLHGQKDTTVPYDKGSLRAFNLLASVPRALVSFPEASHISLVFMGEGATSEDAIIDFLDLELHHDAAGWNKLDTDLAHRGNADLKVAGGLPAPTP